MMLAVAVTAVLTAYFVSYYRLSRRGMREAAESGVPGLLYVSAEEATGTRGLLMHSTFILLYAPLNWVDHKFLGTPGPTTCFMRLSG
jgi:hypothetical protein